MTYTITMTAKTAKNLEDYRKALVNGDQQPGANLAATLQSLGKEVGAMSSEEFADALLSTKQVDIFAEKNLKGKGEDWNDAEIGILGDIGTGVKVKIFDDMGRGRMDWDTGRLGGITVHEPALDGYLLFTNGALLGANGFADGAAAFPDYKTVVDESGEVSQEKFNGLIENRLVPNLAYFNAEMGAKGTKGIVTIPGLGCGEFAGQFKGTMGERLHKAVKATLQKHADSWSNIALVRLDTFDECRYEEEAEANAQYGAIAYRLRPLMNMGFKTPGGCNPTEYQEDADNFAGHVVGKVVAWDHVGKPGNEGLKYIARGGTDDAVAANSTDVKSVLSGKPGHYDVDKKAYRGEEEPQWSTNSYGDSVQVENWGDSITLKTGDGHLMVVSDDAKVIASSLSFDIVALDDAAAAMKNEAGDDAGGAAAGGHDQKNPSSGLPLYSSSEVVPLGGDAALAAEPTDAPTE